MRATIKHPAEKSKVANFGYSPALGYFVDVRDTRSGRLLDELDDLTAAPNPSTPGALLGVLIKHGFFTEEDVSDALRLLQALDAEDIEEPGPRAAALVIQKLQEASSR